MKQAGIGIAFKFLRHNFSAELGNKSVKMKTLLIGFMILCTLQLFAQEADTLASINVDSIVKNIPTKNIKDPDDLAYTITEPFSNDSLKVRAIYAWLIQNIAYNYTALLNGTAQLPYKGEDIDDYYFKRICKTIASKKGICEDYALVFQYLCNRVKIPCQKVTGWAMVTKPYGIFKLLLSEGSSNHAWNAVMINNKWYLLDATFASGYIDTEKKRFIRKQNDYYYLCPPDLFILDHHPLESRWQLLPKPLSMKAFIENAKYNRDNYLSTSRKAYLAPQSKK